MPPELTIIRNEAELDQVLKAINSNGNQCRLSNCSFQFDVKLRGMLVLELRNCIFEKRFTLTGNVAGSAEFNNVQFHGIADFTNFSFEINTRFHSCHFRDEVRFHNTKFEQLADFYNSTFYKKTIFFKTDFKSRTVFSSVTFRENVLFTYALIEDHFILRGATIKKGLDLSLSLLSGTINLFGLKLNDYESVVDILEEDSYDKAVCVEGTIPHKNKRETFRILKRELLNQGNVIDALSMAAMEKNAYSQQLKSDSQLKVGKWYRRLQNRFILFLGRKSNSHGESWTRGVGFTFVVGFLFFYLSIINTEFFHFTVNPAECSYAAFKEGFNHFFEFLNPTHRYDYLDKFKPEGLFSLWDFLGRIFVSFGIYQTVAAFRKYHSK